MYIEQKSPWGRPVAYVVTTDTNVLPKEWGWHNRIIGVFATINDARKGVERACERILARPIHVYPVGVGDEREWEFNGTWQVKVPEILVPSRVWPGEKRPLEFDIRLFDFEGAEYVGLPEA